MNSDEVITTDCVSINRSNEWRFLISFFVFALSECTVCSQVNIDLISDKTETFAVYVAEQLSPSFLIGGVQKSFQIGIFCFSLELTHY